MLADQRGFSLAETAIAAAIVALLAIAAIWNVRLHAGALGAALDGYDSALAASRALAQSGGNGATLAFEPDASGTGYTLRAYRGRPNAGGAVTATSIAAAGSNVALRERTLGAPPFALFVGTSGHVSGMARYPQFDANGSATFGVIAREPACPPGGFTLTFTSPSGAGAQRSVPCATDLARPAAPNPTPTPNVPLLTPPRLIFNWPAAPPQHFAATEWGYTHWFASATGFACQGAVARFPDVLPAPFTPPWSPGEAQATPPPPANVPYSYPNSQGGSTNDAPASFPVLPLTAGLCRIDLVDAFGQHAGAQVQVMGAIALENADGSPAQPIDLLLARAAPVVAYASKSYDAQIIVPAIAGCDGIVSASALPGDAPAMPGAVPAQTPIAVRAVRTGNCTLSVRSQYAGEPPALLGVRVRGPLSPDPPAIEFAPAGTTLVSGPSSPDCYARAYTDATFATPDLADRALEAGSAAGTIGYDPGSGCYTSPVKIAALIREAALAPPGHFAIASSDCGSLAGSRWIPPGAPGPAAWLALAPEPQAAGSCTMTLVDSSAEPATAGLALKVSAGCPNAGNSWTGPHDGRCYDLYDLSVSSESTGSWTLTGVAAFYVPHGTPGNAFLSWSASPGGGCTLAMHGAPLFAQWGLVTSDGGATPPPTGAVTVANGAGFTFAQTPLSTDALAVAPPPPGVPGSPLSACTAFPAPPPPGGPSGR